MNKKVLLEQANALLKAAKEKPEQFQELEKKYVGFKAVEENAKEHGARNPAAVAAAVGRKKYGKEAFQHAAATGHKMKKTFDGMDLAAGEKEAAAEPVGGEKSLEKDTIASDMGLAQSEMKKDDMPHPANSPEDKAHDVSEHTDCIPHALKILDTPEKQKAMLAHLRTLHDPENARSEKNKEIGMAADEKKQMSKTEIIAAAKQMIELAKKEPAKFEELTKAMAAPAPAPAAAMPKPAAPKAPAPAAMMKPKAPAAGMRMSKEEIKADLANGWVPKHKKMEGC